MKSAFGERLSDGWKTLSLGTKNMKRCTELGNVKGPTDPRPNFNLETAKFQRVPDQVSKTLSTRLSKILLKLYKYLR